MRIPRRSRTRAVIASLTATALAVTLATAGSTSATASIRQTSTPTSFTAPSMSTFTTNQRAELLAMATDTWNFFKHDVDPKTHLPLDNLGPGKQRGTYTSSANIGVYMWAVVSAFDLNIIDRATAQTLLLQLLNGVKRLKRTYGFLYQWYDTTTGHTITNPGEADCSTEPTPVEDNCYQLSAVDNGWYASGLMVTRQAFPGLSTLATNLLRGMDFSIFYDARPENYCNTNSTLPGNPPTGQMHGTYYVDQGPASYYNSALYSDPRIAMYVGMGKHQMPGNVWWRTWRTFPPKSCKTDPDFSYQGQPQPQGYFTTINDPQTGKPFRVWEGHYTYPGTNLKYIPTFAGGMFEALMANVVVPETTWGPRSFGLADQRTALVQIKYATDALHFPVWGMSPSSTADDTGGYGGFGVEGQKYPSGEGLALCTTCAAETTVTPHASFIALDVVPQQAYRNIMKLRNLYPGSYTANGGFYDAVNPTSGSIGHRRLVLDQSMIMGALDNALNDRQLQRWFAQDPLARAAKLYLGSETMSLN